MTFLAWMFETCGTNDGECTMKGRSVQITLVHVVSCAELLKCKSGQQSAHKCASTHGANQLTVTALDG